MTTEEIIRLIFSFLGGGLVAGLLDWLRANRSEKKARKVSALSAQIQNLYGPLQFFSSQNESIFKHHDDLHAAYKAAYAGEKWSQDEDTQKNLKEQNNSHYNLLNAYIAIVVKNNDRILEILRGNYSYIDPDDIDIFQRFIVDHTRLKTEKDESGRLIPTLKVYSSLDEISFMRPEFINRVKEKFNAKKQEMDLLVT